MKSRSTIIICQIVNAGQTISGMSPSRHKLADDGLRASGRKESIGLPFGSALNVIGGGKLIRSGCLDNFIYEFAIPNAAGIRKTLSCDSLCSLYNVANICLISILHFSMFCNTDIIVLLSRHHGESRTTACNLFSTTMRHLIF